ncbi:MAG: alpha/beta hydrolase [Gammaproteobacteria bacterium]|jgi:pimeloyl-ACP methyl ester carboxylesterase|nr:alpha/beta hydrolase [Gammaproteobacteria bacterium]
MTIRKFVSLILNTISYASQSLAGKTAFYLFSTPIGRSKPSTVEAKVLAESRQSTIKIGGTDVSVYTWGDGKHPVLFAHGWNSGAARCAKLVGPLLQRGYSVIAFDAQGHGLSQGKTTNILQYTDIIMHLYRVHGAFDAIIGHSFGALCSFHAVRQGVTTKCLVSLNGVASFQYLADQFCAELDLNQRIRDYLKARTEALFLPHTNIWESFSAHYEPHKITAPILVVSDEHDTVVRATQAELVREAYPRQVEVYTTSKLGHNRSLRDPSTIERVVFFVNTHGKAATAEGSASSGAGVSELETTPLIAKL